MKLSEIKYILSGIRIIILSEKSQFVHFLLKRKGEILYIRIIILSEKSQFVHFLLTRKGEILYFNGHVTYDLPMTPKIILSSKWHYGISKPELRAKKNISRIAGTVFTADYFFLWQFWKYAS